MTQHSPRWKVRTTSNDKVAKTNITARRVSYPAWIVCHLLTALALSTCLQAQEASPQRVRVLELALRPHGFDAESITVPEGPLRLVINNRAGLKELSLRLEKQERGVTTALRQEQHARSKGVPWTHALTLTPGTYVLRDLRHARWVCEIVVTPK